MLERLVLENPVQLSNIVEGIQVFRLSTSQRYYTVVIDVHGYPGSSPNHATPFVVKITGLCEAWQDFYYRISHILERCVMYYQ